MSSHENGHESVESGAPGSTSAQSMSQGEATLDHWHDAVSAAEQSRIAAAEEDPNPALTADLRDAFDDFEPLESDVKREAADPQPATSGDASLGDAADDGVASLEASSQLGLHGEEADAFLAQWQAVERSSRRDWFPVAVIVVVIGLWAIGSSGILQAAWHEVRQYQVQRRLERPRAGKSWSEQNRVNGEAPDLRLAPPTTTREP